MKFKFPENMPDNADALRKLREEAIAEFKNVYGDGTKKFSQDEFEYMEFLSDGVKDVEERIESAVAVEERTRQFAELAASTDDDGTADADAEAEAEAEAEVEAEADSADDDAEEEAGDADGVVTADKSTTSEESKALAASGKRTRFSGAAGGRTPDLPRDKNGFRLTTSAQNYESGIVDTLRVAQEFGNLAQGRAARVIGMNGRSETTVAYIDKGFSDDRTVRDDGHALAVLDKVTDESQLPGGSLVAAGGWVSPSETSYSFLPTDVASGLLSLPELTISRGGVKFPTEPDFSAVYETIGFHQTEAQAIAGTEKPCYEVPGAEFQEVRLDVVGVCITSGILQSKAWPELTQKYVNEALRLHQHKMSAWKIDKIVAGSTAVSGFTGQFGTVGAVLSTVELQVADMRTRHRIPITRSVEGIAPEWLLAIIRADYAYRQGILPQNVTDEMIRTHFSNLGANIQFVKDWQSDVIGGATPATAWPTTVDVVLYPAGTWWSATEPVVNLGIIHDSTLLRQNKQIQMFTEDGVAIGKRGPESRLVTIPVSVDGVVGARNVIEAPAEPAG